MAEDPHGEEVFRAKTAITLPGGQQIKSFDISFVDPVLELYLLADRTNNAVDVIDTGSNNVMAQLGARSFSGAQSSTDISGPNGVITVGHREVWAGDGNSTVKVIDLTTGTTTHTISTHGTKRADELCVDPRDHLVLIANDAEPLGPTMGPFVSFISTRSYAVTGQIVFNGTQGAPLATNGIEQCQWSRQTGKFYVNLPEVNGPGNDTQPGAVVVIDPQTQSIENVFSIPLGSCAGPQGMALGPENQILLGCNDPNQTVPSTVVINQHSGAVIRVLSGEDGSDEVWFNDGDDHYFLARSAGANAQQLGVVDAQDGAVDQSAAIGLPNTTATPHGTAHSVAADPVRNQVYVPIPSTAGGTVCSIAGGSDNQGCIAVFTANHDESGKHGGNHNAGGGDNGRGDNNGQGNGGHGHEQDASR